MDVHIVLAGLLPDGSKHRLPSALAVVRLELGQALGHARGIVGAAAGCLPGTREVDEEGALGAGVALVDVELGGGHAALQASHGRLVLEVVVAVRAEGEAQGEGGWGAEDRGQCRVSATVLPASAHGPCRFALEAVAAIRTAKRALRERGGEGEDSCITSACLEQPEADGAVTRAEQKGYGAVPQILFATVG